MEISIVRLFVVLAALVPYVSPANILVFSAIGTISTRISMFPFMEALINKGHQITFLSGIENFEDPEKRSKITYFTPSKLAAMFGEWPDTFFEIRKGGISPQFWIGSHHAGMDACRILYDDPEVIEWIKRSKFDLIIAEGSVNDCAYGLAWIWGSKIAIYGTAKPFPWFMDAFGLPDESSTITDTSFNFPNRELDGMTFWERVKNALSPVYFDMYREYYYLPALEKYTRNALSEINPDLKPHEMPSFRDIERNVSLVFLSVHPTVDYPRSLPPHVIPIGGAVASGKLKPLPKEIEQFMDSSTEGVIYISFGTITEFANFDKEVRVEFLKALASFPKMRFLWKAGVPIKEPLPDNVMLLKWIPQQSVLAHPNLKAFITHAGMGSTAEAMHFGVPAVLLPVFADQDVNSRVLAAHGVGVELEITTLKQAELVWTIREILNNDKYRTKMKEMSKAFKDRLSSPVETAIFWTEYILRHGNSNELLVPLTLRQRQPWWKKRQLDVWLAVTAVVLLTFSFVLTIIYFVSRTICRIVFSKPSTDKKLKSK